MEISKGHKILLKLLEFMIEYPPFKSSFFSHGFFLEDNNIIDLKARIRLRGSVKFEIGPNHSNTEDQTVPAYKPTITFHVRAVRGQPTTNWSSWIMVELSGKKKGV